MQHHNIITKVVGSSGITKYHYTPQHIYIRGKIIITPHRTLNNINISIPDFLNFLTQKVWQIQKIILPCGCKIKGNQILKVWVTP